MADMPTAQDSKDPNFPAHEKNYMGFVTLFKWGTIATAIVTAIVVYIISN